MRPCSWTHLRSGADRPRSLRYRRWDSDIRAWQRSRVTVNIEQADQDLCSAPSSRLINLHTGPRSRPSRRFRRLSAANCATHFIQHTSFCANWTRRQKFLQ
jgi:hypothetical protein